MKGIPNGMTLHEAIHRPIERYVSCMLWDKAGGGIYINDKSFIKTGDWEIKVYIDLRIFILVVKKYDKYKREIPSGVEGKKIYSTYNILTRYAKRLKTTKMTYAEIVERNEYFEDWNKNGKPRRKWK